MKKLMIFAVSSMMLVLMLPVYAQETPSIEISIEGIVRGDAGEVIEVATESIEPDLVGAECDGTLTILNNESVHEGNDLIVATGGVEQVIPDVEAQSEGTIALSESLTLGDTITVDLRFGPDGVSSGGLVLSLVCSEVAATTTTTAPAPTGGVQTGAGGTAGSSTGLVVSLVALSALAVGGGAALLRSRRAN